MQQSSEVQHQTAMIYESPYDDGFSYPAIDIPDLILDYNLKGVVPEKPAIIDGLTGQTVYNYSNLRDRIRHFGGFLQHILSIKKGDVVSYLSLNTVTCPFMSPVAISNNVNRHIILSSFMPFLLLAERFQLSIQLIHLM